MAQKQTEILFAGLITSIVSSDSITAAVVDAAGRSGTLDFQRYEEIALFVQLKTLTGGTSPTVQVGLQTGDGQSGVNEDWEVLNTPPTAWTTAASHYFTSIGPGDPTTASLGNAGRIAWTITGAPATCTFYVTVIGKF